MKISFVVAASTNNAIGKMNKLLWHLPNDLAFFKNTTWGMPVLMGRKTFESIGSKPLKGRDNLILTHDTAFSAQGIEVIHSLDEGIQLALDHHYKELMILGGAKVYAQTIDMAQTIYLTRVHAVFNDADAFIPGINTEEWHLVSNEDFHKDDKHAYDYSFQVWERK
ncbi:MAG: dihydrofolate reductase [Bacteroidetes bacterium]|nr:dihydrofolate reductase [Bacteroidota bacterium]